MNKWLAAIETASEKRIEEVPDGWLTVAQIAKQIGRSKDRTGEHLKNLVESGVCDVQAFRIRSGSRIYPVPHYCLKK